MNVTLEKFDEFFLDCSWRWLNDPEIKKLTNTPDFTREQQSVWFSGLAQKTDYLIWGVKVGATAVGVCGLKNITETDCEYWGYIGEKEYWGKGIGKEMMNLMEEKAKELGLESIWLEVFKSNCRAIGLYEKVGYTIEWVTEKKYVMRKSLCGDI